MFLLSGGRLTATQIPVCIQLSIHTRARSLRPKQRVSVSWFSIFELQMLRELLCQAEERARDIRQSRNGVRDLGIKHQVEHALERRGWASPRHSF
jgi:hypothetical protein